MRAIARLVFLQLNEYSPLSLITFTINAIYKSIGFNKTKRATTLKLGIQIQDIYTYIQA